MGVKDHRRKAEGKKPRFRRMPSPDECGMGTRIHTSDIDEFDESELDVEKCANPNCGSYVPFNELDENGYCLDCQNNKPLISKEGADE